MTSYEIRNWNIFPPRCTGWWWWTSAPASRASFRCQTSSRLWCSGLQVLKHSNAKLSPSLLPSPLYPGPPEVPRPHPLTWPRVGNVLSLLSFVSCNWLQPDMMLVGFFFSPVCSSVMKTLLCSVESCLKFVAAELIYQEECFPKWLLVFLQRLRRINILM